MDYYLVRQDTNYVNAPVISNFFKITERNHKDITDYNKITNNISLTLNNNFDVEYIDWINRQLLLISKNTKKVLELYEKYMKFKTAILYDPRKYCSEVYYTPLIKLVSCLSSESIWNLNKSELKKIILEKNKIPSNSIFQIDDVSNRYIIMRIDLIESLLRRNIEGVKFEKVELI